MNVGTALSVVPCTTSYYRFWLWYGSPDHALVLKVPDLALALALRAALTIFGVTLKLKQDNKLTIVIIIN